MKTGAAKLRWARGGAQRPALQVSELKKTGARSARARTRGQNPLVYDTLLKSTLAVWLNGSFSSSSTLEMPMPDLLFSIQPFTYDFLISNSKKTPSAAVWTCRVYHFPLPAVLMSTLYPFHNHQNQQYGRAGYFFKCQNVELSGI